MQGAAEYGKSRFLLPYGGINRIRFLGTLSTRIIPGTPAILHCKYKKLRE